MLLQANDRSPPTAATTRTVVSNTWASVTEYYKQASYDKTKVQVDVKTAFATLDGTFSDFVEAPGGEENIRNAQPDRLTAQAAKAAQDDGKVLNNYVMMACVPYTGGTFIRAWGRVVETELHLRQWQAGGRPCARRHQHHADQRDQSDCDPAQRRLGALCPRIRPHHRLGAQLLQRRFGHVGRRRLFVRPGGRRRGHRCRLRDHGSPRQAIRCSVATTSTSWATTTRQTCAS